MSDLDDAARWSRAEQLFHAVRALDRSERLAWLERECAHDAALMRAVRELLDGDAAVDDAFLRAPASTPIEGRRIAGFVLRERIGSGGMATVYAAEQDQPRRRVALKLVRGLASDARSFARLEHEAEWMARLDHPNVARVHAAGLVESDDGPLFYCAMELVEDARDLLAYAREHALDRRARIALFESVCAGVEHGHQRGVVHRDLKPANVLVDRDGRPRIIDFGIARALDGAAATRMTARGEVLGTLAYMSPEQADAEQPADTRSDVYALGALLYELLLGERVFDPGARSLTEALVAWRASTPRRPREIDAELPLDLAVVLETALERDPARRYASARELRLDLARWRAHEPIHARPVSRGRRLALFARRHRLALASAACVVATLLGAAILSARAARRARDSEALAQASAQAARHSAADAERSAASERAARLHAERIADLHARLFSSLRPSQALGRPVTVREVLDDSRAAIEHELSGEPDVLVPLLASVARLYVEIGESAIAEPLLRRVDELGRAGPAENRVDVRETLAHALIGLERYAEAEPLLHAVIDEQQARLAPDARSRELATSWCRLATHERLRGDAAAARDAIESAARRCPDDASSDGTRALILRERADQAYARREFADAERDARAALEICERIYPLDHPTTAQVRSSHGSALFDLGRIDEARAEWETALATQRRVLAPGHPDIAGVLGNLAEAYQRKRDFTRADELYTQATELRRAALGADSPLLASLIGRHASLCVNAGWLERGIALARDAVAALRVAVASARASPAALGKELFNLALAERQRKNGAAARDALIEALELQRGALGAAHPDVAQTLTLLGAVWLDLGEAARAEPLLRDALAIRSAKLPGQWLTHNTQSVLGGCLVELGRVEQALPLLETALAGLRPALGDRDFRVRDAARRLIVACERGGLADAAARLRAEFPDL